MGGPFTPSTSPFPAAYQGGYFYGDYALDFIKYATINSSGQLVGTPTTFATNTGGPVDLTFGSDGTLYYAAIIAGQVRRIVSDSAPPPPPPGPPPAGTSYMSDLTPTGSPANGWGPIEIDKTNGDNGANDGGPIVIGGQTFAKGLGIHANSDVAYNLAATCTSFTAKVGIDDDVATTLGVRASSKCSTAPPRSTTPDSKPATTAPPR